MSLHGKRNYNQSGSSSVIGYDSIKAKPQQLVICAYGNQFVLDTNFLQLVQKY